MSLTPSAQPDPAVPAVAPPDPPLIGLCLGAHRSGTSLVAAAMEALGADLALPGHAQSEENLKGFFEHAHVVALDDALLDAAGSAWDDSSFSYERVAGIDPDRLASMQRRARAIIARDWRPRARAAVKDPRMCLLLPFWHDALAAEGYADDQVRHVIVTRDPVEVAISQRTRSTRNPGFYDFGRTLPEGAALWLTHMRSALRHCADRPVMVVAYRDLLEWPQALLQQMAGFLGLSPDADAIDRFARDFPDAGLWRSHADPADTAAVEAAFPGLIAAERQLAAYSGQVAAPGGLAGVLGLLDAPVYHDAARGIVAQAYGRLSAGRRAEFQKAQSDADSAKVRVAALEATLAAREASLAEYQRMREEQAAALEATLAAREASLAEYQRMREEQAAAASSLEGSLRQRIAHLEEVAAVQLRREASRVAAARQVESALRDRISGLGAGLASRDARIREMETRDAATRGVQDSLNRQIAGLDADLKAEALAHHRLRNQFNALSKQLNELELRHSDAEARAAAAAHEMEVARQTVETMRQSRSWQLTQPLRAAGGAARKVKALPRSGLRALNQVSRTQYHRLARTSPETAALIKRKVQPLLTRANARFLGEYVGAAEAGPPPAARPEGVHAFDYQRPQVFAPYRPRVSVIVPNYNHAGYLRQRLDSIFAQTYDNIEVILLDDCSTDDSRQILQSYGDRARLIFNETNSGGVFRQWEKGLAAATGELVWMAESDDWASANFLETLVPFFQNEAVQLAYARTVFMDAAGESQVWSMEEYLAQFRPERWSGAWVAPAPAIVRDVFSMTNIVPNASSAVFRRFARLDVLEIDRWRDMRTCGDWMFYLNAIRGGLIAYSPDAQNFYRIHPKNTSVTSHKADQFYSEHETVARCLRRHYRFPVENLKRMESNLRHHWRVNRPSYSDEAFRACFDLDRILAEPERKPSILMAGYGFVAGGGETFPITLANEMKAAGHEVTFLDAAQEPREAGVRAMLANDIPVVSNLPDLQRIVADFDIDIVHSHHGWVDHTVLDLLPKDGPAATAVTLHGFYETVDPVQLDVLLPRLVQRTGGLVYTAEKNLDALRKAKLDGVRPLHRIDNALGRTEVTPVDRAALGIAPGAFVLTLVSRALHSKGWAEAIEAVDRARAASGADIHLILIGEGEAKDAAEARGVGSHVHMLGFRPDIRDYFAASDFGFLPTRFPGESFPLVVIDCLQAGTPVLASDIGEIRYMLTTAEGLAGEVFALGPDWVIDVEALAGRIAHLATHPGDDAALRARVPAAAARFDPAAMAARYAAVYDEAVARHRAGP